MRFTPFGHAKPYGRHVDVALFGNQVKRPYMRGALDKVVTFVDLHVGAREQTNTVSVPYQTSTTPA